ncbi:MAG: hypothetical protein HC915_04380 [Anaerolineae bacterium]|nr:hypothetical protein [Anaerolineae bacterium]
MTTLDKASPPPEPTSLNRQLAERWGMDHPPLETLRNALIITRREVI